MNLKEWLFRSHTPAEQLKVLEGVCNALHEAHTRGALRSGVGPENVMIISDTEYTIETGGVVPVSYRAPEERSTPTTGIFSAGVILYEILTGKNPFGGLPPGSAQPTPLKSVRRDIAGDLSDAIMACLESDPDWRPKDLSYVLQVVQRLRGSDGAVPPPVVSGTRKQRMPSRIPARSPRFDHARTPRRGGSSAIAIVVGALALVGAGVWFWQKNAQDFFRPPPTRPTPMAVSATPIETRGPESITPVPPAPTPFVAVVDSLPSPPSVLATPMAQQTPLTTPIATPAPRMPTPFTIANATPRPFATPRPVIVPKTPPPSTPAPTVAPTPTPPPPSEPAKLNAIAPRTMPRGQQSLFDIHGTGIRADHRPMVLKGGNAVTGVTVVQQKLVNNRLLRILVNVDGNIAPGNYSIVLVDGTGKSSNAVSFEIPR